MNYFQEFYDAAVAGDEERIKKMLDEGAIIGEYKQGSMRINAAFQLAKDGKDQAVELLRKYGASVHDIARGYAVAGNHKKVEEYRRWHGASVAAIASGYAEGLHHEKVTEYYEKYKGDFNNKNSFTLTTAIAQGYVVANCTEKVEEYRNKETPASISAIALTYAELGNTQAEVYLKINTLPEEYKDELINVIAYGYASGGHGQELTTFYNQHRQKIRAVGLMEAAAVGGHKGFLHVVSRLTQTTVSDKLLARGYAVGGHLQQLGAQSEREAKERVPGLAFGDHWAQVEKYRVSADKNSLFSPRETYALIAKSTNKKNINSSANFLHFLSHCNVDCDLENFAKVLNSGNGSYLSDKALKQVVKKAKSLGHYMKAGMDYEEANALYDHAHEIMNFLYNSTLQDQLSQDIFYWHILSRVTGLEPNRVPAFIEKVKALKWHLPNSDFLNGDSAEELLEKFLGKLKELLQKYDKQTLELKKQLNQVTNNNNPSAIEILTSGIGLVKGHIDATLADHKAKSRFSFFTPDLVKAYREALSVLPSKLVERISAEKVILKVEETSQPEVAKSPSVMP